MLVLVRPRLRLGLDLHINWIGRIAVWSTMGAVGGGAVRLGRRQGALLYIGLAGSLRPALRPSRTGPREASARRACRMISLTTIGLALEPGTDARTRT